MIIERASLAQAIREAMMKTLEPSEIAEYIINSAKHLTFTRDIKRDSLDEYFSGIDMIIEIGKAVYRSSAEIVAKGSRETASIIIIGG